MQIENMFHARFCLYLVLSFCFSILNSTPSRPPSSYRDEVALDSMNLKKKQRLIGIFIMVNFKLNFEQTKRDPRGTKATSKSTE